MILPRWHDRRAKLINGSPIDRVEEITYDELTMYELPLFPLNTVLFPGMPLTLHIFEERYKEMIDTCLDTKQPFGVVLIRRGVEAMGPLAEPHMVGCTAEIAQIEPLVDERLNILAVGRDRFRIVSVHQKKAYLTGTVEDYPLDTGDRDVWHAVDLLRPWVEEYLHLLSEAGDVEFEAADLPEDPEALAYLAATVLQVPNQLKQDLLSAPAAADLLQTVHTLYRKELPLLRKLLLEEKKVKMGPGSFSLN